MVVVFLSLVKNKKNIRRVPMWLQNALFIYYWRLCFLSVKTFILKVKLKISLQFVMLNHVIHQHRDWNLIPVKGAVV